MLAYLRHKTPTSHSFLTMHLPPGIAPGLTTGKGGEPREDHANEPCYTERANPEAQLGAGPALCGLLWESGGRLQSTPREMT